MTRIIPAGRRGWAIVAAVSCWGIMLAWMALGQLERTRRKQVDFGVAQVTVAPEDAFPRQASLNSLASRIREAAARSGSSVSGLVPVSAGPRVVSLDLSVRGEELAVRRFIADVERGRPAIRFGEWQLRAEPGSANALRFEARAVAVQRP